MVVAAHKTYEKSFLIAITAGDYFGTKGYDRTNEKSVEKKLDNLF